MAYVHPLSASSPDPASTSAWRWKRAILSGLQANASGSTFSATVAIEHGVPAIHLADAAGADARKDLLRAQSLADRQCHGSTKLSLALLLTEGESPARFSD